MRITDSVDATGGQAIPMTLVDPEPTLVAIQGSAGEILEGAQQDNRDITVEGPVMSAGVTGNSINVSTYQY